MPARPGVARESTRCIKDDYTAADIFELQELDQETLVERHADAEARSVVVLFARA